MFSFGSHHSVTGLLWEPFHPLCKKACLNLLRCGSGNYDKWSGNLILALGVRLFEHSWSPPPTPPQRKNWPNIDLLCRQGESVEAKPQSSKDSDHKCFNWAPQTPPSVSCVYKHLHIVLFFLFLYLRLNNYFHCVLYVLCRMRLLVLFPGVCGRVREVAKPPRSSRNKHLTQPGQNQDQMGKVNNGHCRQAKGLV